MRFAFEQTLCTHETSAAAAAAASTIARLVKLLSRARKKLVCLSVCELRNDCSCALAARLAQVATVARARGRKTRFASPSRIPAGEHNGQDGAEEEDARLRSDTDRATTQSQLVVCECVCVEIRSICITCARSMHILFQRRRRRPANTRSFTQQLRADSLGVDRKSDWPSNCAPLRRRWSTRLVTALLVSVASSAKSASFALHDFRRAHFRAGDDNDRAAHIAI